MPHSKPRSRTLLALFLCLLTLPLTWKPAETAEPSLLLATTTSVQDSGLLDVLLPAFTKHSGIPVRTVAVGTGAALRMGAEGNADILLTHAPPSEKALVEEGALSERIEIMENYFVIAGPAGDPAGIASAPSAAEALRRIHESKASFVSRADDSGTHKKESQLLRKAGFDPEEPPAHWTRTGSGMGASLLIAGQRQAYILSDIGTFLAFRDRVELVPLTSNSADLRNIYSVLIVDAERFPRVRAEQAQQLAHYLQSPEAHALIRTFGLERFGRPLFSPRIEEASAP